MHAARAAWALGADYHLAYAAPAYLTSLIEEFATQHGACKTHRIAEISGSPSVALILEPTEAGPQGYEVLLRESQQASTWDDVVASLAKEDFSDVIMFPGGYDLKTVLSAFSKSSSPCHIDIAYDVANLEVCAALGRKFESVMLSTSSPLFVESLGSSPDRARDAIVGALSELLLLKENRGGVRLYSEDGKVTEVGAQLRPIEHSVGVGDCFDVAFAVLRNQHPEHVALAYASFVAAEYASTTFPEDFKAGVRRTLKISPETIAEIEGVRLPWESRPAINVYIAAPDFDYLNRSPINAIDEALRYHNFSPRRPVVEHGQARDSDSPARRRQLFDQDMELLAKCQIVVAVLVDNDPGTLIEIGLAKEQGKPVIVFDPFRLAKNLVLQQLPDVLAASLDEAIGGLFELAARLTRGKQ